jgi:NTE family protein
MTTAISTGTTPGATSGATLGTIPGTAPGSSPTARPFDQLLATPASGASLRELEQGMARARSHAEWQVLALQHDELSGAARWRTLQQTNLYDYREISSRYDKLQAGLAEGASSELLYALNEGVHGNMGGMGRPILYNQARVGTKLLIEDYVSAIAASLEYIHQCPDREIPRAEKIDFFRRASHCYGRSALLLSGGAGLIYFHHGVVQELIDHDLLPNVISGASAGAMMAAQLGTRSDEELRGYFTDKRYTEVTRQQMVDLLLGRQGAAETKAARERLLDEIIPRDITFQEAYEKTGRYINISISPTEKHQSSRLMNAITSPNVYIRSAVSASIAIPGMLPPERLYARGFDGVPRPYLETRRWVDGSLSNDLPAKRLARLYGVNHFIVSMINPVVVPFIRDLKTQQQKGLVNALTVSAVQVVGELITVIERVLARRGARGEALAAQLAYLTAMMEQDYLGDINILLGTRDFKWRNALFDFRDDEIEAMILAGRQGTWPKLAMIRNAALISQTLDRILEALNVDVMGDGSRAKHHLVV